MDSHPVRVGAYFVRRLGFIPQFNCAAQEPAILCNAVLVEHALDVRELIGSRIGSMVRRWHKTPWYALRRITICPLLHILDSWRMSRPPGR
jgi:hypothetical protein